ncbi:Six-hairpin glycosidase-like protein [Aspergillus leporis]|uniref:Six-hairpin glycosidase-like protein n=1 Tax=Aspergillus leporis TaxID=41062 RepID=A0A5N5X0H1_9EURO|nr:Six-hairpin glycosidase-like protein [Aspergillus leporis]
MSPLARSFLAPLLLTTCVSAETAVSRAEAALTTLQSWYNESTGIWNTCGWWNGANCMTVLADLALVDDSESVNNTAKEVFANTFTVGPNSNPYPDRSNGSYYETAVKRSASSVDASLWLDGSYDDDAWWALAWIAAYDVTGKQDYLDVAIGIFDHLSEAWPSKCGNGGIDSDFTHVYVNAIVNELFFSLAAHLANRASDSEYYVDWATRQWKWFKNSGMINSNHTINDGLTNDCKNNGATLWSYNQGVVLGGLAELHRAAKNESDLDAAKKIAKAAIAEFSDDNDIIHESCEPDSCDSNATQFKGIFIRNLKLLHSVAPDDAYMRVINASAKSIWKNDRNGQNQLGLDWAGPVTQVDASTHSSAMDALVAAIKN